MKKIFITLLLIANISYAATEVTYETNITVDGENLVVTKTPSAVIPIVETFNIPQEKELLLKDLNAFDQWSEKILTRFGNIEVYLTNNPVEADIDFFIDTIQTRIDLFQAKKDALQTLKDSLQ